MIIKGVDEAGALQLTVDTWKTLKDKRKGKEEMWLECIRAYLSMLDESWAKLAVEEKRSARYIALPYDAVETVHAQAMGMLFPKSDDWFDIDPGRLGRDMKDDLAAPNTKLLLADQHREMRFKREMARLVKWLLVVGNCPWAMNWQKTYAVDYPVYAKAVRENEAKAQQAWAQFQQLYQQYQEKASQYVAMGTAPPEPPTPPRFSLPIGDTIIDYQGPRLICGDPFQYVQDPYADDENYAIRITRFWRTKAYLKKYTKPDKAGYTVYDNIDKLIEKDRRGAVDTENEDIVAEAFGIETTEKQGVEIKELWGTFDLGGKHYENHIITVGNDTQILKLEPSYLWSRDIPRKLAKLVEVPGQLYGYGILEPALGTADYINARANQQIDAGAIAIHPEYECVFDSVFDPTDAVSAPGKFHVVAKKGNITPLQKDLQGLHFSMSEIGMAKGEFQQLTNASNPFTTQHYKKSATEIARDSQVSGSKLQELMSAFEDNHVVPILQLQLQMTQQYMDKGVWARKYQANEEFDWVEVDPQQVRQNLLVRCKGAKGTMDKAEMINNIQTFLATTMGNELMSQQMNMQYLAKRLYTLMTGGEDADKVFPEALAMDMKWYQEAQMAMMMINLKQMEEGGQSGQGGNAGQGQGGMQGAEGQAGDPGLDGLPEGVLRAIYPA